MNTTKKTSLLSFSDTKKHLENVLRVCAEKIERLTHPERFGCCLCRCNSIVINKERLLTITTDKDNKTTHEFSPLYPTYFAPETARDIIKNDILRDIYGKRIKLEIIGSLEYYRLLHARTEESLNAINDFLNVND